MGLKPRLSGFDRDLDRLLSRPASRECRGPIDSDAAVWRPSSSHLEIVGDLRCAGNVVVATGADDGGLLVVRGDVSCRNLIVGAGFGLACGGALEVAEVICATAADSITLVAGPIRARLLDSGSGAWLTAYDPAQLAGVPIHGYAMVAGRPLRGGEVDLDRLLVSPAIETEEWDELDPRERASERRGDYVRVDDRAALRLLAAGRSILR